MPLLQVSAQAGTKPNIILIVADDLNDYIDDLGGSPEAETPNIDRLTSKGTVFTNATCPSPLCCPSRTSFLTGKDASYTQIYSAVGYKCTDFSKNFTPAKGNDEYFTIPGYLKDSAGYFTYGLNKIFHCYENYQEYDATTIDPCSKGLSWNKIFVYNDSATLAPGVVEEGITNNEWAVISDTMEKHMMDYVAVDSVTQFIRQFVNDPASTCNNPFFIALGIKKPHKPLYIPEKYFREEYIEDFYAEPFDIPYNYPFNAFPVNGVILPPQPEIPFSDYYNLPADSMGQHMVAGADDNFVDWAEEQSPLPEINPFFNDSVTLDVLGWSKRTNCFLAYIAGVKYIDAQIGRLLDSLEAIPEVYNNTVIIIVGDNGYSLSEKKHWGKRAMWETDLRIPFVVTDLRNPEKQISNASVSLLDLFPTICDLAGVAYPTFTDSSSYLDGTTLIPLMDDPAVLWERPQLTCVKKETNTEGSCNPQYSVRNNRFHYIRYQSNGGGDTLCDPANSYFEEELYDIGYNRETDPNEWNNLGRDKDFRPVMTYLQQWLPDSIYFLQKTYRAVIDSVEPGCFLDTYDTLSLSFQLFDTAGTPIAPPGGLLYQWTNNLTDDTLTGSTAIFPISTIPDSILGSEDYLIIYLAAMDTLKKSIAAFDMKYVYVNPDDEPEVSFSIDPGGLTCSVENFIITGAYKNFWWEIEGDSVSFNALPGPITFDLPGVYTITCHVTYGNNNCINSVSQNVKAYIQEYFKKNILFALPNPAHDDAVMYLKSGFNGGTITLWELSGTPVKSITLAEDTGPYYKLDLEGFQNGFYIVTYQNQSTILSTALIIAR